MRNTINPVKFLIQDLTNRMKNTTFYQSIFDNEYISKKENLPEIASREAISGFGS